MSEEKYHGPFSAGRLSIGIISIILFLLVSFQSCAAGLSNSLEANGSTSGSSGIVVAFCMLISGIVGICTRNSKGKAGAIITAIFYLIGALTGLTSDGTFGDLPIWGGLSFIFAVFFIICAVKTKKNN